MMLLYKTKDKNDSVVKRFKVPLAYAPKEKFIVRLTQQPDLQDQQFSTILPRMGFQITGLNYDPSRKLNKLEKLECLKMMAQQQTKLIKWFLIIVLCHII